MSDPLNSAIVLYLGYGTASFPHHRREAVEERFGDQADELLRRMDLVFETLDKVVPYDSEALAVATKRAVEAAKLKHPELTDETLAAIGWSYSYGWK